MLWDIFISHASDDKAEVARPLQKILEESGLRVWLDENQLEIGDSLREKIDEGLAQSRFGLVILSPAFFAKQWPKRELDALWARETSGRKAILPVWHNLTQEDILKVSPLLANLLAVSTSSGLNKVAQSVLKVAGQHLDLTQRNLKGIYTSDFDFPVVPLARSIEVIKSLGSEHTWKHLVVTNKNYPYESWMGTDSSTLIDVLYDLLAPLVEFQQMSYGLRRSLYVFRPKARLQFGLLEAALQLLSNDLEIASMSPPIEYTPKVDNWREQREKNPQRFWLQGVERERFIKIVPFFLKQESDAEGAILTDVQGFRKIYLDLYRCGTKSNQQVIGLPANAFYGFSPKGRPVFWRILICLARIYQAALGNAIYDSNTMGPDGAEKVFTPTNEGAFPYNHQLDDSVFHEAYDATVQATSQYIETLILPKLRSYLRTTHV